MGGSSNAFVVFVTAIGVVAWLSVGLEPPPVVGAAGMAAALVALSGWAVLVARGTWPRGHPTVAVVAGALVGVTVVGAHHIVDKQGPGELGGRIGDDRLRAVYRGSVTSGPFIHPDGWIVDVELESIDGDGVGGAPGVRLFVPGDPGEMADGSLPVPGDVVSFFGRLERYPAAAFPHGTDWQRRMSADGVEARGTVGEDDAIEVVGRQDGILTGLAATLARGRIAYQTDVLGRLGPRRGGVVLALTTGTRGFLDDRVREAYRQTGTGHLLAISGLHLGILAAVLWWGTARIANRFPRWIGRYGRRRVCGTAVLVALGAFVWVIGAPVSAVRAWFMVAVGIVALIAWRPTSGAHALAGAGLAMILWQPSVVAQLGFQLSFAATAAILGFLAHRPRILEPPDTPMAEESTWRRRARKAGTAAGLSICATLATWPVVVAWTGYLPLCGLWLNVVVPALFGVTVFPAIFVGAAVGTVVPALGDPVLAVAARAVLESAEWLQVVADGPGSGVTTGVLPGWAVACVSVGVGVFVVGRWRGRSLLSAASLVGIGLFAGTWAVGHGGGLQVDFLPVGQGDAILIRGPDDRTVLIDAGGSRFGSDPGRDIVVPYLRRQGISHLDWVVATHADIDHVGGLDAVIRHMEPGHVVFDPDEPSPLLRSVVRRARRRGAELHGVDRRLEFAFGSASVLVRRPRPGGRVAEHDNDASLVTTVSFAGRRLLFPGDIESAAERWLSRRLAGSVDVLAVPHHGSKTSSGRRFLRATAPSVGVVSAGRFNPYGHPHPFVVRRYRSRGIPLFETAAHGLIRVEVDASGRLEVRTKRASGAGRRGRSVSSPDR